MSLTKQIERLASKDIRKDAKKDEWFLGRPYYLDFDRAYLLINDAWKEKVGGIPQGTFILDYYENANDDVEECLLLRAIKPAKLPTDNEMIASMVDYYKGNLKTSGKNNQIDDITRYTFSFAGLECRILGTFYRDKNGNVQFGADVENFYSPNNYAAYKPDGDILEQIVNFRDGNTVIGRPSDYKIGKVRYSSSCRFQEQKEDIPVYVSPSDFLGKRTALFGMTRTGKSNTVKKVMEATSEISNKATQTCLDCFDPSSDDNVQQFSKNGLPKFKVGQIIFDMNGEYANSNLQDEGTAIFEKYRDTTTRYSVLDKTGFKVLKANFYNEINTGFEMIRSLLAEDNADYINSFLSVDLEEPDKSDRSAYTRWERKKAIYLCCLNKAGFTVPQNFKVIFEGNQEINNSVIQGRNIDPKRGISLNDATSFWEYVADHADEEFFTRRSPRSGLPWLDEDMRALLVFLTRKRSLTGQANLSGYRKLSPLKDYHSTKNDKAFEIDIIENLRKGNIVIIDLSQGDPVIQQTFAERICKAVFRNAMSNFVNNKPNNFIQFYFEEAHNLFPKKEDKDLSGIYNRIAKEGAKLNIGMIYATQEVSSISSNILKNTQNWFIAHLNNEDELREIKKFYDFADFCDSLIRYSSGSDKGFIRMKTYSNAFIVPVQIDRFTAKGD